MFKIKIVIIVTILQLILLLNYTAIGQVLENNLSLNQIKELSISSRWSDRLVAAQNIVNIDISDTLKTIELIIEGMKVEINNPSSSDIQTGNILTGSQRIMISYLNSLVILSNSSSYLLKSLSDTLRGDEKEWIILALGYKKDGTVHEQVRDILINSPSPALRLAAIKSLAQYQDSTDTDTFLRALDDSYKVTCYSDQGRSLDEIKQGNTVYPIRAYVVSELAKRDIEVVVDEHGNYEIRE